MNNIESMTEDYEPMLPIPPSLKSVTKEPTLRQSKFTTKKSRSTKPFKEIISSILTVNI